MRIDIFSAIAAVAATASAVIAGLVLRRQSRADRPTVVAVVRPLPGNWHRIDVELVNQTGVGWSVVEARVRRPRSGRIVSEVDAPQREDGLGNRFPDLSSVEPYDLGRSTPMHITGSTGRLPARNAAGASLTDRHSEALFLFASPSRWSRRLSILLTLVSSEAVQRRTAIAIRRTLTAESRTAKD